VKNNELNDRRLQATPRGIGVMCNFMPIKQKTPRCGMWKVTSYRLRRRDRRAEYRASPSKVIAAIEKQLHAFTHTAYQIVPYEGYVALAERINERVPIDGPAKTAFFSTGAEAVENAVKIARAYTKRPGVITFGGGFHGRTYDHGADRQGCAVQNRFWSLPWLDLPRAISQCTSRREQPGSVKKPGAYL
jgi:4-aminobutyrate aminotransferase